MIKQYQKAGVVFLVRLVVHMHVKIPYSDDSVTTEDDGRGKFRKLLKSRYSILMDSNYK